MSVKVKKYGYVAEAKRIRAENKKIAAKNAIIEMENKERGPDEQVKLLKLHDALTMTPHKGDFAMPWSAMTQVQRNIRRVEMRNKSLGIYA